MMTPVFLSKLFNFSAQPACDEKEEACGISGMGRMSSATMAKLDGLGFS